MSDNAIIANQWECLTEPERTIANTMVDNLSLLLGQVIQKDAADALFLATRGSSWEIYRDAWKIMWSIIEVDLVIGPVTVTVYTTLDGWPTGVLLCRLDGHCGDVTTRCTAVTGVFP